MLIWERKILLNTCCDKNLPKLVELHEVMSKICYVKGGNNIAANNIAIVYKCSKTLDHFLRDMAINHCNIVLGIVIAQVHIMTQDSDTNIVKTHVQNCP